MAVDAVEDDELESEAEKESLVSSKGDMMDRASDTTDSGISIRVPLGNGGETWTGIEERSDKASQTQATDLAVNQGPYEKTNLLFSLNI